VTSPIRRFAVASGSIDDHVTARHAHKDTGFVTSGNVTAVNASFTAVGPDLIIAAEAGDVLVLEPDVMCASTAADVQFDAATRVSGANNRWWSSGTGTSRWTGGLAGWYAHGSFFAAVGSPERYTVNADDVVDGQVTVRFYARSTGGDRAVQANTSYPARWALYNIGPAAS
jgi:hypothetical protein